MLTGLMFVVIALTAEANAKRDAAALEAFATPQIVHFGAVLLIGALITMPRHSIESLQWCVLLLGLAGLLSALWVNVRARRQTSYAPQLEDWIWHGTLPPIAYASLLAASLFLGRSPEVALVGGGGSALLLLFIGIHNSWDSAVWMITRSAKVESDQQQIRSLIDRWRNAAIAGDLQTILSLMADDAIFLTPGQPSMTRDAFAAAFREMPGGSARMNCGCCRATRTSSLPDRPQFFVRG